MMLKRAKAGSSMLANYKYQQGRCLSNPIEATFLPEANLNLNFCYFPLLIGENAPWKPKAHIRRPLSSFVLLTSGASRRSLEHPLPCKFRLSKCMPEPITLWCAFNSTPTRPSQELPRHWYAILPPFRYVTFFLVLTRWSFVRRIFTIASLCIHPSARKC
jgi:hypothetical protein